MDDPLFGSKLSHCFEALKVEFLHTGKLSVFSPVLELRFEIIYSKGSFTYQLMPNRGGGHRRTGKFSKGEQTIQITRIAPQNGPDFWRV